MVLLTSCSEIFHKECLIGYVKMEIEQKKFPLCCPQVNCKKEILPETLHELGDADLLAEFEKKSTEHALEISPDARNCPTPDCTYKFIYDEDNDSPHLFCQICHKEYCLKCNVNPYHH